MDEDLRLCTRQPIDVKAFERVLTQYDSLIRKRIYWMIFQANLRDDAYQELVLNLLKKFHTYDPNKPFKPWLSAVIRTTVADILEEQLKQTCKSPGTMPGEVLEAMEQGLFPKVDIALMHTELRAEINEIWPRLLKEYPNRSKLKAYYLRYHRKLKLLEIAERFKTSTAKDWPLEVKRNLANGLLVELAARGWEFNNLKKRKPKKEEEKAAGPEPQAAEMEGKAVEL